MLMTNRRLYAQLSAAFVWLWCGQSAVAQPRPLDPPCGACMNITIAAGQLLLLPETLSGLTVLVRFTAPSDPGLATAFDEIRRRGGRAGLAVVVSEEAVTTLDRLAFDVKQTLTEYRAAVGSSAVIAVVAPAAVRLALLDRGLAAYADLLPPLVPAGNLAAALDSTRQETGVAVAAPADVIAARAFLDAAARAAALLPRGLAPVPGPVASCGTSVSGLMLHPQTQEHVALLRCRAGDDLRVAPPHPVIERADLPGDLLIVRLAAASGERFAEDVQVRAGRRLAVEEVIARHQAAVRRQAALTARVISSGTMTLTFEAPGFPAPLTVSARTIVYADHGRTEVEQRDIRINGVAFQVGGAPRLPILEPERVASLPLVISLTDQYRYRLEDDDTVNGIRCYVVSFDPAGPGSLFSGRAWIAMEGFGMARVGATQTGLRGAIISSEQVDDFREVQKGVWLPAQSDIRQIYEGAGHRTPIHRQTTFDEHALNPSDFEARRDAAYASPSVMLRDTPQGYRYLRRQPATVQGGAVSVVEVAKAATHVRTLAGGVIIDPNIRRPLPFAGISYVDFDLWGTGTQFTGFFGGAYAQMAFSVPSILKSRWQLAGRAFGIASSYNDRSFRNGREIYTEAIRQRPAHASIWVLRPLTSRISVRAGYDLDYTRLRAAPETGATFVVPPNQVVHAARVTLEGQRAGWTGSVWWNPARRVGWRPWGGGTDYHPGHETFQRFGVGVVKSTVLSPRLVTRVEAQWMDGRDLDRFSRYSFGTFDNRLRGYPSALVRYDRGGVARGAVAWSAAKVLRLDGFIDAAAVRDPGYGRGLRNYTGIGGAAEVPAPFGLLTAVEWGYGFRGVNTDGSRGTHVVRVSLFKVF